MNSYQSMESLYGENLNQFSRVSDYDSVKPQARRSGAISMQIEPRMCRPYLHQDIPGWI